MDSDHGASESESVPGRLAKLNVGNSGFTPSVKLHHDGLSVASRESLSMIDCSSGSSSHDSHHDSESQETDS
jgi:hypothetical protein